MGTATPDNRCTSVWDLRTEVVAPGGVGAGCYLRLHRHHLNFLIPRWWNGRHAGFRHLWLTAVRVQAPLSVPVPGCWNRVYKRVLKTLGYYLTVWVQIPPWAPTITVREALSLLSKNKSDANHLSAKKADGYVTVCLTKNLIYAVCVTVFTQK